MSPRRPEATTVIVGKVQSLFVEEQHRRTWTKNSLTAHKALGILQFEGHLTNLLQNSNSNSDSLAFFKASAQKLFRISTKSG